MYDRIAPALKDGWIITSKTSVGFKLKRKIKDTWEYSEVVFGEFLPDIDVA